MSLPYSKSVFSFACFIFGQISWLAFLVGRGMADLVKEGVPQYNVFNAPQ